MSCRQPRRWRCARQRPGDKTADTLTIERTRADGKVTLSYKLDGSESRNMIAGRGGQPVDSMSTAKWDGSRLTIVTRQEIDGQVAESTKVWTSMAAC